MTKPAMKFDWYPFDRVAYKRKTLHLSLAEDGAYRRLIDEYMAAEGALPDNDAALARIIGVSLDEWLAVAPKLRPFFESSNGKLVHSRCEEELRAQSMRAARRSQQARDAANARHKRDKEIKELVATSMPRANGQHAQAVPGDATLDKDITTTFSVAAGEEKSERSAGLLATAPNGGALRSPASRKIEPSTELRNLVGRRESG